METERNKFKPASQPKGGKDSTKFKLTAAGAVAVGAGVAVAANEWNNEDPANTTVATEKPEENVQNATEEQTGHVSQTGQTSQQVTQNGAGQQQSQNEIQPVDNNHIVEQDNANTISHDDQISSQETETPVKDDDDLPYDPSIDDVDPDLIAQEITAVEVDPNDIDVADVVVVDYVDVVYFEDGSEMPVALVHTEDNEQYLMVDVNDDMTFDLITDLEGNPIAAVDGNLTMSDVLDMYDETGNELAYTPETDELELAGAENPEHDIINTEEYNELAMVDRLNEEPMPEDEDEVTEEEDLAEFDTDTDEGDMIDDLEA